MAASKENLKIAILGWGSLIWDPRPEFDQHHGEWQLDGPVLSLEFSRISNSRKGALTLVIDSDKGEPCAVAYAMSRRRDPNDAICDLRCREGTVLRQIGCWFADGSRSGQPETAEAIKAWTVQKGFDVTVWTGLPSNFKKEKKKPFTPDEAVAHVLSLSAEGKALAAEYVWRAPNFVSTPLRRALQAEPWFAALPQSKT